MAVFLFVLGGLLSYLICYFFINKTINQENLLRNNYRGQSISTIGGLILVCSIFLFALILAVIPNISSKYLFTNNMLIVILGFSFFGLIDDLIGDKSSQGFKGHIKQLVKGNVTTGAMKIFGGPAITAIAISSEIKSNGYLEFIIDVITISLIVNLFNLFDLAPGRTTKYSILWIALLFAFNVSNFSINAYFLVTVLVCSLIFDLREKFMLGDIGSNAIGAVVGFITINLLNLESTLLILVFALLLNLVSEFISFSKIIDKIYPLRFLDSLGQKQERKQWLKRDRT
ncbi:MAG: hypothetical protein U0R17_00690 [Acidimicrobiia bacterium]